MKKFINTIKTKNILNGILSFGVSIFANAATGVLSISTNKLDYAYGEAISITLAVTNNSSQVLSITPICLADYNIDGVPSDQRYCIQMYTKLDLNPGQSYSWNFTFTPGITTSQTLLPGEHKVTGFLNGFDTSATATFTVQYAKDGEGKFCGGIAAFSCPTDLFCKYNGTYPDAGGYCLNQNTQIYNDVAPGSWYYYNVQKLAHLGYFDTSEGNFNPNMDATREDAVRLLVTVAGLPLDPTPMSFQDSGVSSADAPYIQTAQKYGIVQGYTDAQGNLTGYFGPYDPLTREAYAKMVVNTLRLNLVYSASAHFFDVPSSRWSYNYVETLYSNGIVNGIGYGLFAPSRNMNRAEMAAIIARVIDNGIIIPKYAY